MAMRCTSFRRLWLPELSVELRDQNGCRRRLRSVSFLSTLRAPRPIPVISRCIAPIGVQTHAMHGMKTDGIRT